MLSDKAAEGCGCRGLCGESPAHHLHGVSQGSLIAIRRAEGRMFASALLVESVELKRDEI